MRIKICLNNVHMSSTTHIADIFGKPGTGAHAWRIGPFAAVDLIATLCLIGVIVYLTKKPPLIVGCFVFGAGILAHRIFGVKTAVDVAIFGR